MQSGFVKVTLSLIVLLLLVIAFRPLSKPETAQAAASVVQYKILEIQIGAAAGAATEVEKEFNNLGRDGWTLVACPAGAYRSCVFMR
jgi:hypothetical protein